MLKMRWSWDCIISNIGIPIMLIWHLYIETAPWFTNNGHWSEQRNDLISCFPKTMLTIWNEHSTGNHWKKTEIPIKIFSPTLHCHNIILYGKCSWEYKYKVEFIAYLWQCDRGPFCDFEMWSTFYYDHGNVVCNIILYHMISWNSQYYFTSPLYMLLCCRYNESVYECTSIFCLIFICMCVCL